MHLRTFFIVFTSVILITTSVVTAKEIPVIFNTVLQNLAYVTYDVKKVVTAKEIPVIFNTVLQNLAYVTYDVKKYDLIQKDSLKIFNLINRLTKTKYSEQRIIIGQIRSLLLDRKERLTDLMKTHPDIAFGIMNAEKMAEKLPLELATSNLVELETRISNASLKTIHVDTMDTSPIDLQDDHSNPSHFIFSLLKKHNGKLTETPLYVVGTLPVFLSSAPLDVHGYALSGAIIASVTNGTISTPLLPQSVANPALGRQKTLVVLARFLDSNATPPTTKRKMQDFIFGSSSRIKKFYAENSYSKTSFSGTVTNWITMPRNAKPVDSTTCQMADVNEVFPLIKDTYNLAEYDRLVLLSDSTDCLGGGYGTVGKSPWQLENKDYNFSVSWVAVHPSSLKLDLNRPFPWTYLDYVIIHELGHNLGVMHANSWSCDGFAIINDQSCKHTEYGNNFSAMGYGNSALHFDAFAKDILGWFNNTNNFLDVHSSVEIVRNGSYTLKPLEKSTGVRMAKIKFLSKNTFPYYIEYRHGTGFDSDLKKQEFSDNKYGVFVSWVPKKERLFSRLLDMRPNSSVNYWEDGNIVSLNNAWTTNSLYDTDRGIQITQKNKGNDTKATFEVKFFEPECIRRTPTIATWFTETAYPEQESYNSFTVTNNNSPICPKENYFLSTTVAPSDWVTRFDKPIMTIDSESDSEYNSIIITPPANAALGEYWFTITAASDTLPQIFTEFSFRKVLVNPNGPLDEGGGKGSPPIKNLPTFTIPTRLINQQKSTIQDNLTSLPTPYENPRQWIPNKTYFPSR